MKSKKSMICIIGLAVILMCPGVRAEDEDAFDKGVKLMSQQDYIEAIHAFSTAIEMIPRDYQAYNYRGIARALTGEYGEAIVDYSKAIEIRPRYAEAYNNRGFARTRIGDLGNAINDYSRALEINPFFVDAYNNKAWVLATCADQRYRDGGQAVRLAQKAVELKPDVTSLDTLAAAYAAVGNFDAAVDTQKKAIQKLLLADKPSEVPKYLPHLNAYKSGRSLLINYTARAKTDDMQDRGTKVSLKKQTEKPSPPAESQKATAPSGPQTQKPAVASKPSSAVTAPEPAAKVQTQKPAAEPKTKESVSRKPSSEARAQKAVSSPDKPASPAEPKTKKSLKAASKPSPAASAQETGSASNKPAPAARPKTKKAAASKGKPSPPVVAQKASTAAKPQKSPAAADTKKTLKPPVKPLPYTIQVSAYRDPGTSNRVAQKLITGGDPAFTSPVELSEKGKWYRIYIGNYTSLAEAKAAAAGLKNRKFRYVHIARKPYAVQVGMPASKSETQKLMSRLKTKGYLAYSLPAGSGQNKTRILIGAFESREAAENLAEQLKQDGFDPKIGLR